MLKNKMDGCVEKSLELALGGPRYFRRWGRATIVEWGKGATKGQGPLRGELARLG